MRIERPSDDELVIRTSLRERLYGVVCILAGITVGMVAWLAGGGDGGARLSWELAVGWLFGLLFATIGACLLLLSRQTTFRRDRRTCLCTLRILRLPLRSRQVAFDQVGIVTNQQAGDSAVMLYRHPSKASGLRGRLAARFLGTKVADFGGRTPAVELAREIAELTGADVNLD